MSRILIVDDLAENCYMLDILLRGNGFETVLAENGAAALEVLRNSKVDLVISDILMPVMDGYQLCRECRNDERSSAIPFVFYTATYTEQKDEKFALSLGADRFLVKPQPSETLLDIVRDLLLETHQNPPRVESGPLGSEMEFFRQHNATLFKKLEEKMVDLEREIARRVQVEAQLRESEGRFRSLFENAALGIYQTTPEGRILMANPALCRMLGYTTFEELRQLNLEDIGHHPDYSRATFKEKLEEAGSITGIEAKWIGHDGKRVFVRESARAVRDAAGTVVYYEGYVEDITESVLAQTRLRETEARLQHLISASPVVIYTSEAAGDYAATFISPNVKAQTGYEPGEFLADPRFWSSHIHPADLPDVFSQVALLPEKEIIHHEFRFLHRDGAYRWIREDALLLRDTAGKPMEIVGSWLDITERKRAEEELRQSEEKFSKAFHTSPYGIIITRPEDGAIVEVNRIFAAATGFTREETLGGSTIGMNLWVHDEDRQRVVADLQSGREVACREYQFRMKNGEIRTGLFSAQVLKLARGTCILSSINDITDRVRAQEEVRALNASLEQKVQERTAQLQAANEELEAFTYSISHELKAPLRSVAGFSRAVIEDFANLLPPEGQDQLQRVQEESVRMGQLIDDLLRLSHIGQQEMNIDEVDVSALALSILKSFEIDEPERRVRWVVDPDLTVRGDAVLLRVLLNNLLGNALKYTSKVDEALIQVHRAPCKAQWIRFSVSDNGAGFDPAYADRLFTPFRRLHSPDEFPGTGIGLAIVRRIVNRHGAEISAEGCPGKGATFTLTFPATGNQ